MIVQAGIACQASLSGSRDRHRGGRQRAAARLQSRQRLKGSHCRSRSLIFAQAKQVAGGRDVDPVTRPLALFQQGQSLLKELTKLSLDELNGRTGKIAGTSKAGDKMEATPGQFKSRVCDAIVEAEGLPFTNRYGAAVNFQRLADADEGASEADRQQAQAIQDMLASPAFAESQQAHQELIKSTLGDLQAMVIQQGLARSGNKSTLIDRLLEARGLPFIRHSDGVPINLTSSQPELEQAAAKEPPPVASMPSSNSPAEAAAIEEADKVVPVTSPELLPALTKAELAEQLQVQGLRTTGLKADMLERLQQHLFPQSTNGLSPSQADIKEPEQPHEAPEAVLEVEQEAEAAVDPETSHDLEAWTVKDLRALLGEQGLNTKGRKPALVKRASTFLQQSASSPSGLEPPSASSAASSNLTMAHLSSPTLASSPEQPPGLLSQDQWQATLAARASPAPLPSKQIPTAQEPALPEPQAALESPEASQSEDGEWDEADPLRAQRMAAEEVLGPVESEFNPSRAVEEASALQGIQAAEDAASAQDATDVSPEIMSNAGRQLPQEDESAPEWETETLDPEVQARSDRPTDVAAAEQLPSPDLDLQNPGTDFRRDAFELQQTDDVTTREDSAQALGQATDDDLSNTDVLDEMARLRDRSDGAQMQLEREELDQETELSAAQDADIDTDVELGLNVDMSEFEGDEEAEADALHDEENEELAQAAFELEQPDSQDADIDALVGSLDDDFEDLAEAEGQQGTEGLLADQDEQEDDDDAAAASAAAIPNKPEPPRDAEHGMDLPSLAPNLLPENTVDVQPISQDAYLTPDSQQAQPAGDSASASPEASLGSSSSLPSPGPMPSEAPLGSSILSPRRSQAAGPVAASAEGSSSGNGQAADKEAERKAYEAQLIRSNSFQDYGFTESGGRGTPDPDQLSQRSPEDAAELQYRRDLEEENFEGETYQKLDAEADALSRGKNVEREVLDRVKQEVSDTMDMGAMDAEARDRYLLDVANEIDMGELEARAREQYKKDMAEELEKGTIEERSMEQLDADLIKEYRMSSMEEDIRAKINRDLEAEIEEGQIEADMKDKLSMDLQSELDSVEFEDDQRSKLDDDLAEGLASMDLEYDEDLSFQQELETELGRPYKSAREAALDMMQERLSTPPEGSAPAAPNVAEPQEEPASGASAPPDQSSPELSTDVASTAEAAAAAVDRQQRSEPSASLAAPPAGPAQDLQAGLQSLEEDLGQLQAGADLAAEPAEESAADPADAEAEQGQSKPDPLDIRYQADQASLADEASRLAEQRLAAIGDDVAPSLGAEEPQQQQQPAGPQQPLVLFDMSQELDQYLEQETRQQQQQQQQAVQLDPIVTDLDMLPTQSSTAEQLPLEAAEAESLPAEASLSPEQSVALPEDAENGSPPGLEQPGQEGSMGAAGQPADLPPGLMQGLQEESEVVAALREQVAEKQERLKGMQADIELLTYSSKSRVDLLAQVQEQLAELRSRQDHDLRETLAGDLADLRAAAGRSPVDSSAKREITNDLNGLEGQLAALDTDLSQKEGLATQLHRQLAGVRERLARQGRAPLSGPMVQEAPPRVNGTHLPSLKASSPSATIPEGHLFETADTERSSASRTSPAVFLTAGVLGVFGAAKKIFQRPPKSAADEQP